MSLNPMDPRIRIKGSTITGATPSIGPSSDFTDGTWTVNDIYTSEFFLNKTDDRLWVGTDNGVVEVMVSSTFSSASPTLEEVLSSGNDLGTYSIIPTTDNISDLGASGLSFKTGFIKSISSTTLIGNTLTSNTGYGIGLHSGTYSVISYGDVELYTGKGIKFGTGPKQIKVELAIGDWNMVSTGAVSPSHGLSSTEWKTVRNISFMIRNDFDDTYIEWSSDIKIVSTTFKIARDVASFYNSTDYDSTSYNRGWITYWYTPD